MNDVRDEGAVVGRGTTRIERRPLDPMAFPGIRSTNTVGLGELTGDLVSESVRSGAAPHEATLDESAVGREANVGHHDAYGLALNVSRRLYDHGIMMQGSPALANLTAKTTAYINHFDTDRLGLHTGDRVSVIATAETLSLGVTVSDDTPRGTIEVVFSSLDEDGSDATATKLYDPASAITQVKLATS